MQRGLLFFLLFAVFLSEAVPRYSNGEDRCKAINCVGEEFDCIQGRCYCAQGYISNPFQTSCIKCPGLGESCYGRCCNKYGNETLQCWHGICQNCYDQQGIFVCRDSLDRILLVSITQVAMGTALVLGIIATFVLLYKFCAVPDVSSLHGGQDSSRLSVGSLQLYVEERLRDAPPRYTRSVPPGSTTDTVPGYLNQGFIHDSSVPPPPYSPPDDEKDQVDNNNATIHI